MTGHVVLLGDSIFDNGVYVRGAPDVVRQLRGILPPGWRASLLAVDGAVTSSVERQLAARPEDASLLVLSVGGNDALGDSHLLREVAGSVGEALMRLADAQSRFADRYEAMIESVLRLGIPTAICTIYDANIPAPEGLAVKAGLAMFNDVITRAAFARGLALIDLRLICSEPADYANSIEPSEQGGAKIAAAIAVLTRAARDQDRSLVISG